MLLLPIRNNQPQPKAALSDSPCMSNTVVRNPTLYIYAIELLGFLGSISRKMLRGWLIVGWNSSGMIQNQFQSWRLTLALVALHVPVTKHNNTLRTSGNVFLVSYQNDRISLYFEFAENLQDLFTGLRVQVARRFVR